LYAALSLRHSLERRRVSVPGRAASHSGQYVAGVGSPHLRHGAATPTDLRELRADGEQSEDDHYDDDRNAQR